MNIVVFRSAYKHKTQDKRPFVLFSFAPMQTRLLPMGVGSFLDEGTVDGLPAEGLEPTRPCGHWILSPARLPIPPRRQREPETSEERWNLKRLQRLEVAGQGEDFALFFLAMWQVKAVDIQRGFESESALFAEPF